MFYIYILYSSTADKFYVGYSEDPWARLQQHRENSSDKFTGKYEEWALMAVFEVGTSRSEAMSVEKFIKKQKSRKLLIALVNPAFVPVGFLARLIRVPHLRN